jgi:putative addiction module killer protein
MFTIKRLPEFDDWFYSLRDRTTTFRLGARLDKLARGILGDVKPVGGGVVEMREFFGPGWRMYYVQRGDVMIVMLGGGDKASQDSDIEAAKNLATTLNVKE